MRPKEKIIVSACLLEEKCRYDGQSKENLEIMQMAENFELIPVCPEVLGGLPVPRPASEIETGDGNSVLAGQSRVIDKSGNDLTACFVEGAQKTLKLAQAHNVQRVILKSKSPSCGLKTILKNGQQVKGCGVTAALLLQNGFSLQESD